MQNKSTEALAIASTKLTFLNDFGVQEMDTKEMKKTDGGFVFELLLGVAAGYGLYHLAKKIITGEW